METLNFGQPEKRRVNTLSQRVNMNSYKALLKSTPVKERLTVLVDNINSETQNMNLHKPGSKSYFEAWNRLLSHHKELESVVQTEI